jgi:hypothetical protein
MLYILIKKKGNKKVPIPYPLFPLVDIELWEGEALESEEGKGIGHGLVMNRGDNISIVAYERN